MIIPQHAIVRPRVVSPDSGEILPLEIVAAELVQRHERIVLQIQGGAGSGKTTALQHLAAVLGCSSPAQFLDDPYPSEVATLAAVKPVVFSGRQPLELAHHRLVLAPWTDDDLMEYLLVVRPDRCATVLGCVRVDPECRSLRGNPALCRAVLDSLSVDEPPATVRAAVENVLSATFHNRDECRLAAEFSLAILVRDQKESERTLGLLARSEADFGRFRLLRHPFVQQLLAGDLVARHIAAGGECPALRQALPQPLVTELARRVREEPNLGQQLQAIVASGCRASMPQAATILFAAYPKWRPQDHQQAVLTRGSFCHAAWAHLQLPLAAGGPSQLQGADLSDADLREAVLDGACASQAQLTGARLDKASLVGVVARKADLCGASLIAIDGDRIDLRWANLRSAVLDDASLIGADLEDANLDGASFRNAGLRCCHLLGCQVAGADFRGADLSGCCLRHLVLREAELEGARFREADLSECDLEGVRLASADFFKAKLRNALLTGSLLPCADLRHADLRGAGLAEIHWENADLREADLRGCTFHMGSTRCGLVGSPYPGHGSKTGFYTDDYHDQGYKAPEEIRKANLCGADLRGAKLDEVDFYLVDLREALFDSAATEHLIHSGAILDNRCT